MNISRSLIVGAMCLVVQTAVAGDWPQILGPQRNGIAENEKLAATWPATGPKTVWERPVGSGLAGVSVAKGTVYLFHRVQDEERLEALDALNGVPRWQAKWPTNYRDTIAGDDGPRTVPLIHGNRVYAYGAAGTLACLNTKDGSIVWSRNLIEDYEADLGYFGAGSSPLIEGETIIVNVGGQQTKAGIVCLALDTGKEVWKSVADTASYSSPIAVTVNNVRHVLCITRLKLVALDPATGKVRSEIPFGQRGPTVNGANPVLFKNNVLLTASYGIGSTLVSIQPEGFDTIWSGDEILSSQYTTPIVQGDVLFGVDGRQDQGSANLLCFDPVTRKIAWHEDDFGLATLILADGKLLCMKTNGTLVVAEANPKAYKQLATAKLFSSTCRPLPALAQGRLYVRDTDTLKCIDLRPAQ